MTRNVDELTNDPGAFVMTIVEMYDRNIKFIQEAFKSDQGFVDAMDKVSQWF